MYHSALETVCDILLSRFAFKLCFQALLSNSAFNFNLRRYTEALTMLMRHVVRTSTPCSPRSKPH